MTRPLDIPGKPGVPAGTRMDASSAPPASRVDLEGTAFRLLSVRATSAPPGGVGRDWLEYCIGQGRNVIKGYRRGNLETVRDDVEKIVIALNERRRTFKSTSGTRRGRPPRSAAKAELQERDE
jgi:hypothetical protein